MLTEGKQTRGEKDESKGNKLDETRKKYAAENVKGQMWITVRIKDRFEKYLLTAVCRIGFDRIRIL